MKTQQLFPKPPRRMKQPTKDTLRAQLREQDQRIIAQSEQIERLRRPWWKRLFRKAA